jgi:hypothetical protein
MYANGNPAGKGGAPESKCLGKQNGSGDIKSQTTTQQVIARVIPLVILVAPVRAAPPGYFRATLDTGELLCAASRQPFLDGCRVLIERGYPPARVAVMRHAGSETDSFRATLRRAARLTVAERADEVPRFALWKPLPEKPALHRAGEPRAAIEHQAGAEVFA